MVAFLSVNAPNNHLSLVFALVVQGDADTCNTYITQTFYATQHKTQSSIPAI